MRPVMLNGMCLLTIGIKCVSLFLYVILTFPCEFPLSPLIPPLPRERLLPRQVTRFPFLFCLLFRKEILFHPIILFLFLFCLHVYITMPVVLPKYASSQPPHPLGILRIW